MKTFFRLIGWGLKLFLLLAFSMGYSQAPSYSGKINGLIHDAQGHPAEFVTLLLLTHPDTVMVKGVITDATGKFAFDNIPDGNYQLKASLIGWQTTYSEVISINTSTREVTVPTLVLKEDVNQLAVVEVVAQKKLIEVKADKLIFNVSAGINAIGSNAMELLKKAPGVTVSYDDQVSLKGKSGVKIMINGKLSPYGDRDIASVLKSMSSEEIDYIEVISNPSARYDASGNSGIINIVLKKNRGTGLNGSVSGTGIYGITPKYRGNGELNYRNKNINIFGTYGYSSGAYQQRYTYDRTQNNLSGQSVRYDQNATLVDDTKRNNFKAGADYFLKDRHTLGVLVNGNIGQEQEDVDSRTFINLVNNRYDSVLLATNNQRTTWQNLNYNLNYRYADTTGRVFNIDADYGTFDRKATSYQPNTYYRFANSEQGSSQFVYRTQAPTTVDVYAFKSDYEQKLWGGQLETGIKLSSVTTDNNFLFYHVIDDNEVTDENRTNRFTYKEHIYAGYLNYNKTVKKWTLQGGLRAEQTRSDGNLTALVSVNNERVRRKYLDLFPSGALNYKPNDNNSFGLTYSRRIGRASYQDLNPFEFRLDELTFSRGNSFLRPQLTHNAEFSYAFKELIIASVGYSHTSRVFAPVIDTTEGNKIVFTQQNVASNDNFALNLSSSISFTSWWSCYANVNLSYSVFKGMLSDSYLNNSAVTLNFNSTHTFTFPKGFSGELFFFARTPEVYGPFRNSGVGEVDVSLQKRFAKDRATLKVSFTDIFYNLRLYSTMDFNGLQLKNSQLPETRLAKVTLNYRFGSNDIKAFRNRRTSSEEERDRAGD